MSEQETTKEASVTQLPERRGLKKGVFLLPNLVTTGALFSGFYAIIAGIVMIIQAFKDAGYFLCFTNMDIQIGANIMSIIKRWAAEAN